MQRTPAADEQRALRWLMRFSDPVLGVGWNPRASTAERWRLGRMRLLLDLLGAPDRRLRIVLIAGTKGKGSTAAMLASILHAGGVLAGLYTSPQLQVFRERVRIDGAMLSRRRFARAVDVLRPTVRTLRLRAPDAGPPTTFELVLALALVEFARTRCAVGILEVGLGGALDATNATDPAVSVITSISYDHTQILGRSLTSIAREKAGVMRADHPALLARQRPSAARALRASCAAFHADCTVVDPLAPRSHIGLPGDQQRQNAALAAAAAAALASNGIVIGRDARARGLHEVVWPGRFEIVPGTPLLILDGAHNGASAEALARELARQLGRTRHVLVVGIARDKDARAVLAPVIARAKAVVATSSGSPRALPAEDLASRCRPLTRAPIVVEGNPARAIAVARRLAGDDVVCVTGSLALVGAVRDAVGLRPRERWW